MGSTRTWRRISCWDAGSVRALCFVPTTTGRCRRWWRQAWALPWRRCSPWTRPTRRCGCCSCPKPCHRASLSCCGIGIATGRVRWPRSSTPRSPWRRRSSGRMTRSSRSLFWLLHREDELEAVDLVVLRPDLLEPEALNDREGGIVVGRDAHIDLRFALGESPPDQCARRFFGEASPAKRREDRVADLRAADRLGGTVKAAVPDHHLGVRDHEARRPVAAIGVFLHAMELDRQESVDVVAIWKFLRQGESKHALRLVVLALDEVEDRSGVEGDQLESLCADGSNQHCVRWLPPRRSAGPAWSVGRSAPAGR